MVFQRVLVLIAALIDKIATAILPKSWASELRVLVHLAVHPVIGDTHKARLESFYGHQAGDYDAFRKRLLTGREELIADMDDRIRLPQYGGSVHIGFEGVQ